MFRIASKNFLIKNLLINKHLGALLFILGIHLNVQAEDWVKVVESNEKSILHLTGRVVPQDGAQSIISSRIQGRVISMLKKEGEKINVGTALYAVSSADCLSVAEERRIAQNRHIQDLLDGVNKRETQLGIQIQNDQCFIVSNYSGVLVKRNQEVGSTFNPGDNLANLVDTTKLTVELDVPEKDISLIHPGDKVHLKFSNGDKLNDAIVDLIVPTIDPQTRTSHLRLKSQSLKSNLSKYNFVDAFVTGDLEIQDLGVRSFLVPTTSLIFNKDKHFLIKQNQSEGEIVEVKVLNEIKDQSQVAPIHKKSLQANDMVKSQGALFLFQKLK